MRVHFTLLAIALTLSQAIGQYVPPNRYNLPYTKAHGFPENKGQIVDTDGAPRPDVKFYSEGSYPGIFMCKDSWTAFSLPIIDTSLTTPDTLKCLRMHPVGELAAMKEPIFYQERDYIQNFYFPWTGAQGAEGVRSFSRILYENIYPSIDEHFFSAGGSQRIAFVVRPGGNPANLELEFDGQDSLSTDIWGGIKFFLGQRSVRLGQAQAYQVGNGNTIIPLNWSATYDANNGTGVVSFNFQGYDHTLPLVFEIGPPPLGPPTYDEPGLCWSTYFGGNGQGFIEKSTTDPDDNYYVAGRTYSTFITFPPAPGNNISVAGETAYVCQLSSTDNIAWKTFFGVGSGDHINVRGLAYRAIQGAPPSVYIVGSTSSTALQTLDYGTNAYTQLTNTSANNKGYIARFQTDDQGHRIWAEYLSASQSMSATGLALASNNNLYVTGVTRGGLPAEMDAPASLAEHWPLSTGDDGFVIMFNAQDRTQWVTPFGGSGDDQPVDIRFGKGSIEKIVIVGNTTSITMQTLPAGGDYNHSTNFGDQDVFLYEFSLLGDQTWATFIGGTGNQQVDWSPLAINTSYGDVVIVGNTAEPLPQMVHGPGWYDDNAPHGGGFIVRFSGQNRNCTWFTHVKTSYPGRVFMTAACFDNNGNLFFGGEVGGQGMDVRTPGGIYYSNAIFPNYDSGVLDDFSDCFLMSFTPQQWLPWWSYFGGNGNVMYGEHVTTMLKRHGNLYAAGYCSKEDPNYTAYFPLDDSGGVPYFSADVQGTELTGYIASFCADVLTGMERQAMPGQDGSFSAWTNEGGGIDLIGLPIGAHHVLIYDALGKLLWDERVMTSSFRTELRWRSPTPVAMYLINVLGEGSVRTIIH